DKATYELEAQASGVLTIAVGEGQEVAVGAVIGSIGGASPPAVTSSPLASPKARRLAAERGVDLASVTASSADGVISAADVERAAAAGPADASPAAGAAPPTEGRPVRERRPLTGIRKTAARRLHQAWQTIPHIVQMVD